MPRATTGLLERLEALKEGRASAKAELDLAQKQLDEALASLRELGINTDQDLEALSAEVNARIEEFEAQISKAEIELGKIQ